MCGAGALARLLFLELCHPERARTRGPQRARLWLAGVDERESRDLVFGLERTRLYPCRTHSRIVIPSEPERTRGEPRDLAFWLDRFWVGRGFSHADSPQNLVGFSR